MKATLLNRTNTKFHPAYEGVSIQIYYAFVEVLFHHGLTSGYLFEYLQHDSWTEEWCVKIAPALLSKEDLESVPDMKEIFRAYQQVKRKKRKNKVDLIALHKGRKALESLKVLLKLQLEEIIGKAWSKNLINRRQPGVCRYL